MTNTQGKIAVFIDGSNLYAAARGLNMNMDYRALLEWIKEQGRLVRVFYYTAVHDEAEFNSLQTLVDWLDYNGFTVVKKRLKQFTDSEGRQKTKGNMDIEIAVDMMELADRVDSMVLFSGDGDFRRLVESVQRKGVRVTVCSTIKSEPPMCADELRRQADTFLEMQTMKDQWNRKEQDAPAEREPFNTVRVVSRAKREVNGNK